MKKNLCTLICLLSCFIAFSQSVEWQWARSTSGSSKDICFSGATDSSGNLFITGYFESDSISFGSTTLYNAGYSTLYLAKYTSSGNLLWVKSAPVASIETETFSTSVATDAAGNAYITGSYGPKAISFDSITLLSAIDYASFLAKFDSSGQVLWAKNIGGVETGGSCSAVTTGGGAVYLTGNFDADSLDFGNGVVGRSNGVQSIFVAKFDAAGNALWARTAISPPEDNTQDTRVICMDAAGNVCIAGVFNVDTITFGNVTLTHTGQFGHGFTAKYDSLGNFLWVPETSNNKLANCTAITGDALGNIYVSGDFEGAAVNFDTFTVHGNTGNQGIFSVFLVKYDAAGNIIWTKGYSEGTSSTYSQGFELASDIYNRVYLGVAFIGTEFCMDNICFTANSNVIDLYMITIDTSGAAVCGLELNGGTSAPAGLCTDKSGNAYICSEFGLSPFIAGNDTFYFSQPGTSYNIYIDKFKCTYCYQSLNYQLSASSICAGDTASIAFTGDSAISISPGAYVWWVDTAHALLIPDTTTQFTISGFTSCAVPEQQTFTVSVASSSINITSNKLIMCPGDTAQICAPAGLSAYNWNNGNTTTCISVTDSGNYYVSVSQSNNCPATSNHISIGIYPATGVPVSVSGDTLTGFNGLTYQWFLNGSPIRGATNPVYIAQTSGSYILQITDSNGCVETSTVVSGIKSGLPETSITVFPNPTSTGWQLNVTGEWIGSMVEVFDATGRSVFKSTITNQHSMIEIAGLANGVYELRLTQQGYNVVRKLVKI